MTEKIESVVLHIDAGKEKEHPDIDSELDRVMAIPLQSQIPANVRSNPEIIRGVEIGKKIDLRNILKYPQNAQDEKGDPQEFQEGFCADFILQQIAEEVKDHHAVQQFARKRLHVHTVDCGIESHPHIEKNEDVRYREFANHFPELRESSSVEDNQNVTQEQYDPLCGEEHPEIESEPIGQDRKGNKIQPTKETKHLVPRDDSLPNTVFLLCANDLFHQFLFRAINPSTKYDFGA